jgi:uncharacterized Fe-S center protein
MTVQVFWGSPRQTQLDRAETLPAKLDLILERLHLRERVKDHQVAIKVHLGNDIGYSMIHPLFIHKVVAAVKEGGGHPFVTDIAWDIQTAAMRGYTPETLGCPIYPAAGLEEKWFHTQPYDFMGVKEFQIGGAIKEASFLVDLAHVKGHPITGFGAAIKNIGLGCVSGQTRGQMHDVSHYVPYVHKDKIRDEAHRTAIRESCPYGAIVDDRADHSGLHLHHYKCNGCQRCQAVADGAFDITYDAFMAFIYAMNIAAKLVMDTFEPGNATFINIATNMTPICDCFGFSGMAVMADAGIFGSDDIVAIDQAVIDMTADFPIIEQNLPGMMEIVSREGHPWQWIHGPFKDPYAQLAHAEEIGLGTRAYELVDVFPVTEPDFKQDTYVKAQSV